MCARTQHAFQPVYMSISAYKSLHCVLRQMQLTVLSIKANFSSMLRNEEKVIFCSQLGDHFAEHEREQEREREGRTGRREGLPRLCESTSTGFSCMK